MLFNGFDIFRQEIFAKSLPCPIASKSEIEIVI
jgi:hypothetical protein